MDTHLPFEGDVPEGDDEPTYEWLDEWLCEYVDGTMDPSLEAVFEKYVEANPELKAHIERLRETRELLCNCGLPREAPEEVDAESCRDVDCDEPPLPASVPEPTPEKTGLDQPLIALGLVSSVAAALVVGFLVGAMVVGPVPSGSYTQPLAPDRAAVDAEREAPSLRRTRTNARDRGELPSSRAAPPLAAPDSGRSPPTITTIGTY